ncbi:hypothetical protein A0H81_03036 [Grifola frondosa]|uniref:Uncharacterized protein n=1 Tax=Grifola frondosa TaxID=5627 RepID=A0A1C7MJ43_GRIFR|nr:hypothetical protein A0H81_03036 [Grifola frondosa]
MARRARQPATLLTSARGVNVKINTRTARTTCKTSPIRPMRVAANASANASEADKVGDNKWQQVAAVGSFRQLCSHSHHPQPPILLRTPPISRDFTASLPYQPTPAARYRSDECDSHPRPEQAASPSWQPNRPPRCRAPAPAPAPPSRPRPRRASTAGTVTTSTTTAALAPP